MTTMALWGQPPPVKHPPQDERLSGILRWVGTVCSGLSLAVLLGLAGVIISLRDNQIRMELMFNELVKKVERGEDLNDEQSEAQQKNTEANIRQDLAIMELQRKLNR